MSIIHINFKVNIFKYKGYLIKKYVHKQYCISVFIIMGLYMFRSCQLCKWSDELVML